MVRRSAAGATEAGHQVTEGNALALVAAAAAGGGGGGGPKEPAGLPCPRCESTDTKFCYYNNYSLGQPRHFCKGCRRYWTRGGALRNVPVGGGTRRGVPAARRKRATSASSSSSPASALPPPPLASSSPAPLAMSAPAACSATARPYDLPPFKPALASPVAAVGDPDCRLLDLGSSFTSLLAPAAPDVRFSAGFLVGGLPPVMMPPPPASSAPALLPPPVSQALPEGLIWGMGWPDLSI